MRTEFEKLVFCRVSNHCEQTYFFRKPISRWQVLPQDKCWVCERWREVVFFFDRRKHCVNHSRDVMGKIFMIKLNEKIGLWDVRRVSPTVKLYNPLVGAQIEIEMCPLMKFCALLDPAF